MKDNVQVSSLLGTKIRDLRQQRGLTLVEVSRKSGLSAGFLSKIERGLSQPSINNLHKICYILNTTINDLALPAKESVQPIREPAATYDISDILTTKDQRSLIYNLNDIVKLESIFSLSSSFKLDAMTLSGTKAEYVCSKHRYDEIGIVAKGKMSIQLENGHRYIMEEGDLLRIPSDTEHKVSKISKETCISFWIKLVDNMPVTEL